MYCVNTVFNAGPHCKLVCITKCAIHPVEIKDIIIIIIIMCRVGVTCTTAKFS